MTLRPRSLVAFVLLVATIAGCSDPTRPSTRTVEGPTATLRTSVAAAGELQEFVEGQVIVRVREGVDEAAVLERHGVESSEDMQLDRAAVVTVPDGTELISARDLAADPDVEFAEPNYLFRIAPCEVGNCEAPNDPFLGIKWDLDNTGRIANSDGSLLGLTGKVDADIDWLEMHDALGPDFGKSAIIGIIDSGIRPTHNDLAGRVLAARNFAAGYPADLTADRDGHGTHVAGIAAASSNNALGVSGVAYGKGIRLLNAKACDLYVVSPAGVTPQVIGTVCPASSVADAITWAVDNGANVLNLSLGGDPRATSGSAAQQSALRYALSKNVLAICASGNDNYPAVAFPARFPECVAVGATSWSDTRASYSNFGPKMELSAPGGDSNPLGTPYSLILSTYNTSDAAYAFLGGTSMAAPQVSGLAAMLYANGLTSPKDVLERLESTADDLGSAGQDPEFGYGRINAYRAITGKNPDAAPTADAGEGYHGFEGSPVLFDGSRSVDPNNHPLTFAWLFGDGATGSGATPSHTFADNGEFTVALTVTDESSRTASASRLATIENVAPAVTAMLSTTPDDPPLLSGETVDITGSFSDPGVRDAPWTYTIDWGNGATIGHSDDQTATITEQRRYCTPGEYNVDLTVADKDGGFASVRAGRVTVVPVWVRTQMPSHVHATRDRMLSVTIYGSETFDATTVDPVKSTLGNYEKADVHPRFRRFRGRWTLGAVDDFDLDGYLDMRLSFSVKELLASGLLAGEPQPLVVFSHLTDGCLQVFGENKSSVQTEPDIEPLTRPRAEP